MARNTPESPLIGERYKSGCAWRLYRIFDFRKGHSRRKFLSNGQHNIGTVTQDVNHDLLFKSDEKYTSGDPKRKRTYGCKSISSVPYDSANVRKKDFSLNERKAKRAIVCQKLIDGNYQAKDQASHQSKDLVNALQILYSNKELFVDILHDPNSLLVKETHGAQDSQSKRIRRKKLMSSNFEARLPVLERNRVNDPKDLSNSIASCPSRLRCDPQSSETIVMLKPGQGRGQTFEEKMCRLSSQHYGSKLSYKENTAEESDFSFAQMKRKLRYVGGRREELRWMTINDESNNSGSCHFLENGKKVQSRDVLHFDRSSLYLAKSKEIFDVKDFEARIGHGFASSNRVLSGNGKFSFVRDTEQTDLELHGEANEHNTKHLYPRNEDSEEIRSAERKTNFTPDCEWSTGTYRALGREVATHVRYSPHNRSRTLSASMGERKGETGHECFDPMRQNMDDLSWEDVKNQNFRFKEFGEGIDLTDDPLADKLRRDCWSSVGQLKTTVTNNSMNVEEVKGLEVPSKPRAYNQSHRWTVQSSDTARKIKGVGYFLESPSGIQSSITPRAEYSGTVPYRAEQRDKESQQLFNEDVTRPPSSRGVLSAEVPFQAFEDNCEKLQFCDPLTLPADATNKFSSMGMAEYVKTSLQASNLNWDEFLFKLQSADQILGTSLFNELQGLDNQFCGDRQILFDYMKDVILEVFQYCLSYSPWVSTCDRGVEMLMGERSLLLELKKRVEWFSLQQQPSPRTLEQHVEKDLAEIKWWLSKYTDMEKIGTEIEGGLLEDAIIEIVFEMLV